MADNSRLEDLRRRVQNDPASIAFAQLAEEYRRGGHYQQAIDACRAGLAIHPGYLSARVTLGRALLEIRDLNGARAEFEIVLKSAPENLAAVRGLAEVFHRRGDLDEALVQYRAALSLARNDPDLEQTVGELTRQLAPKKRGLFDAGAPTAAPPVAAPPPVPSVAPPSAHITVASAVLPVAPATVAPPADAPPASVAPPKTAAAPSVSPEPAPLAPAESRLGPPSVVPSEAPVSPPALAAPDPPTATPAAAVPDGHRAAQTQVQQTIEALEQWLDAIHVSRSNRSS
jgi:tetratricopeptide (TPR) repeat protein